MLAIRWAEYLTRGCPMLDVTVRANREALKQSMTSREYWPLIDELCNKAELRGGYIRIRLDLPTKAKTSPENRLFHALVGQLSMYRQTSPELMKRYVKIRACAHGYPCDTFEDGQRRAIEPKSVANASTTEVAILIECCYMIAAEWGVELTQREE